MISEEGFTEMEPDGYLQPTRRKYKFRCGRCGKTFSKITTKILVDTPPCPKVACQVAIATEENRREIANLKRMLEEGRAPGHIGANNQVKAVDETAKIVMEDYKLTDLKDNVRTGDSVAPKLPPSQQQAAEGFFNGAAIKNAGIRKKQMDLLGRRAMAGAFRNMAVAPNTVVKGPGPGQEARLRSVRTEIINKQ